MKSTLRLLSLILAGAAFGPPGRALAQTPTLEFTTGAGNPTGNGPTTANQVITFQNNTDNPTGGTFAAYTPTTQATFVLSNFQYTLTTAQTPTTTPVFFGGGSAQAQQTAAFALFPKMNAIGAPANGMYSSVASTVGTGIDIAVNNSTEIYMSAEAIPATVPANARYRYADLTINFNQAVVNPVIQLAGLGSSGSTNGGNFTTSIGFTTELDLLTTGVTLSRLSGSNELTVNATQILNNATSPGAASNSGAASGSVLVTTPSTGITSITFRLYLRPAAAGGTLHSPDGSTHSGDGWTVGVSSLAAAQPISGYVYEDVNYGGGAGRPRSASGTVGRPNARVELYNSAGTFVSATTTDANGLYTFNPGAGTYTVRVVNSSVTSSRTGAVAGLLPVQTYNGTTTAVGGANPAKVDAGNGAAGTTLASLNTATTIAESQAVVTSGVGSATATGADFGFNFDVVVNTNDTGQGSLRQFITNSNALGGEASLAQAGSNAAGALPTGTETSIFMIPDGAAHPGLLASGNGGPASQLTGGVAIISPASVLPTITSANTSIDATTQSSNIGDTNAGTLGAGGTVGTAATALSTVNRPEVQLVGNRNFDGVVVGATNAVVRGLSLYGFNHDITVNTDITLFLIERNVIGTSATSFTDPGVNVRTLNEGVLLNGADNGIVRNNLIGYNGGMGVWVLANGGNGSNNNTISGNEIRGNAQESKPAPEGLVFDGLELQGNSTGNTVSGNLITANYGHGIDSFGNGIGGNTVTGNTISNNGVGVATNTGEEGSGLRIFGATNQTIISNNVLSGNNGSGVLVTGSANNVTISQNSTFGNTRLGVDLISETNAPVFYNGNTGTTSNVTINDSGDGDTGGNGLLNFPVITRATLTSNGLLVQGFARPGSAIELFTADNTPNSVAANVGFGQGRTYLGTFTEGSTTGTSPDTDNSTGTYGPGNINGLNQGTDNTNAFSFLIPLTGNFAGLAAGATLTSTATLNNSTSEFSGNATLAALTGYVYEDVNYGGGAGRPRSASGAVGRPGATVELYNGTTLVGTTTTDANGQYTFGATPGTYTVRVVNSTVTSSRTGYVAGLLPVQTYNGTTTAVGGANPAFTDAAANSGNQSLTALTTGTSTPQSVATVTTTNASTTGPDFGFNFDVVVNTNNAGQGSLRQFITNANALGGEANLAQAGSNAAGALPAGIETSIFMIPNGTARPGLLASGNGGPASQLNANGVAVITPATILPSVTGANTSIDGSTQTFNIGNTNNVTLGTGGTVGTGATALSTVNGPEVQLTGNTNINSGLYLTNTATGTRVTGLAVYGFGNSVDADDVANIVTLANNTVFTANVLGSTATSFSLPTGGNGGQNVRVQGGTGANFTNNLVGFAGGTGIYTANGVTNVTITNNEFRSNANVGNYLDGVDAHGASLTVTNNLFAGNAAQGFDSFSSAGSNVVTGNTFTGNGVGNAGGAPSETAAIRIYGTGNTVSQNVVNGNYGAGVAVTNGATTIISQNSIFNNGTITSANGTAASGEIGIDLLSASDNANTGTAPYVTINDNGDTDTGGNGLLNFPVITSATISNGNLVVQGFARPGSVIELFNPGATADASGFGEGQTYLGTFTEGSAADTDNGTGTYSGAINGLNQGTDNTNRFSFTIPLTGSFAAYAAGSRLTSTATLSGATSEFSGNATVTNALTGYVYEDVNYGGGAGRPRSASGTVGRSGARVELYDASGNFVTATTTDTNGQYAFNVPAATYTVRVVNSTVSSSRTGYVAGLLPVQTYNGTTTAVGGINPAKIDAGNGASGTTLASLNTATTIAESQASFTLSSGASAGPDFGFNFDVVVNTNDTGQGSLRQFITNANALGGEANLAQAGSNSAGTLPTGTETSIFMIPDGAAHPGLLASGNGGPASQLNASGVAAITPATALPAITGTLTRIDGTTQSTNIGNTNGGNTATLGVGGTVGTGATALSTVNRPEVQLIGSTAVAIGLDLSNTATNSTIAGLAIYGFGNATDDNNNANIRVAADNTTIAGNVVGNSATNFTTNSPVATNADNVRVVGGAGVQVTGNLIGFANGKGVAINPGVTGTTVSGNEIRSNAQTVAYLDGVDIQGSNATIANNLLINNSGQGIDSYASAGGNTITGNTVSGNGVGNNETAGVRIYGANNTLRNNVVNTNYGTGIMVVSSASNTTISQNSIFDNGTITGTGGIAPTGQVGIDLLSTADDETKGTSPFVTLNDNGDGDTGGNGLLNFPVLTTANVSGTSLVVTGYARPGSLVELFLATPPATGPATSRSFGQGSSYLTSRTEGNATDDSNTGTGSYSGLINGVNQGTDNTNLFTFTIPLSSLTAAQRTALLSGNAILTSTATLANSTSEFSGNLALPITDVTVALTGPQTVSPGQPTGTYTATFTNEGPVTASNVTRTVTLPSGATNVVLPAGATLSGNVIDFGTVATLASGASNSFSFSFTPATTATGTVAITSNISTATSQGNNNAPDASTINATVVPVADVFTTIAATTTSVAGGTPRTAGTPPTFTVTFNNNGPNTAAGVVAAVQLPTGLTNVVATNGGTYNSTTGIVSYTGLTSIASGTPTTSVITFDAPAAGPIAASATITTTTAEANQTANNQASATMAVVPAFDLLTTLTGPASAVAGDLVTLNVTTTNNGPSPAANAVQTVQIGQGLSNVYVSNGGVYNSASTTQTIVSNGVSYSVPAGAVVFPTLASLATGQTVANTISFSMPNATVTPTASVTPNTASSASTAGDTNTGNNSATASVTVLTPQAGTANAYTTISTSAATTTVGTPVTLTVTTGNNGPNAATGVTQTVQLMPGFTTSTIQVNGTTGTLSGNTITFGTGGPTYDTTTGLVVFPTLTNGANGSASGTSVTNTIRLTPSAATSTTVATTGNNGQILAMAGVRTTNTDPVAADNVASVGVTVAPSSDLATTITGPASAQAGQSVTYTASFVNNGPMAAAGVIETAQLPTGLSAVTITDANGNAVSGAAYNATTGLVTFPTLTSDASGATQVFKLTFAAPAQSFTPRSSIASTSTESTPANNSASVATSVAATADLATLVSGPATAVIGNPVTYTVTTTNNGPVAATNAATTLQLPAGFDATTLRVNGTTGVLSGTTVTYTFASGATATYSTTSGLVTFPTVGTLTNGTSVSNYVTFVMPNATGGQVAGVASVSASGNTDPTAANNSSSVATSIAPTTTTSADLVATLSTSGVTTVAAGGTVTYTATYSNAGTDPGVNVVPTLQLLPGLTTATLPLVSNGTGTLSNGNITFSNGASYNQQTGILTFPTIASQATGSAGTVSYTVQVIAPNNGPLLATAATTSNTSEPNTTAAQTNNAQSASVNITPSFNEVTRISGPTTAVAGTSQTYTVTTVNNGPSATSNATTQTVTVPAGQTPTNITGGGVYSSGSNTITWTIPAGQSAGVNGAVANSFTIVQPTTATTLTASVTVTGESNTGDNSFAITTSPTNLAPLAYAVVNTLQNPQSNDAGGLATGLLISPLNASDPENSFATAKYTVVAIPSTAQGTLYYNNAGTYTAVTAGQTLTDTQAQTLRFKAATGYVGNASFTYLTTDAAGNTSPVVNYTIPVATDVEAAAYSLTPTKGGSNPYVAGDVIAYTIDTNGAVYNAATAAVYQTNGTLQPQVAGSAAPTNGIAAASAVAGSITGPGTTSATVLSDIGLAVDATGRLVVAAAPNTSKLKAGSYSVQITTTDVNGGVTTRTVSFTIPAFPLPVVLSAFTASAVANRDALLDWTTASEINSAAFDIERSFDGVSFTKVGQQTAKGTSSTPTAYAFTDKGVASLATTGLVYYRLRQVDLDGKAAYSPVRTVSFTKAAVASLSLFPNPAQTTTSLDLRQLPAAGTYQVSLLDATGRVVRTLTLGGGQLQSLEVSTLASGSYIVLVTGTQPDGSALRQALRLTKE